MDKTILLAGLEDQMMFDLYPNYPVISFAADPAIEIVSINKGNQVTDAIAFANDIKAGGKVIAYKKDGTGFDDGSTGDGQFNAYVKPSQDMGVYLEPTFVGETAPYNNLDAIAVDGQDYWQVKATKVTGSFSVQIKECALYNITVENNTSADVTCPAKFASKATRCEFEISSSSAENPLTAATCNGVSILDIIAGEQNKKKTKWAYSFDPNNEKIVGDVALVFGAKPSETQEVA